MKRLTTHKNENYNQPGCNDCSDYRWRNCKKSGEIKDCIQRLTWIRLLGIEDILGDEYNLDRLKQLLEACNGLEPNEIDESKFLIATQKDPKKMARLRELIEADREGRIAVFPCKPSDVTVYQLRNKKHALGIGVHPRHVGCAKVWGNGKYELLHGGDVPCKDKDFGKTWFLKEDEAQAALKEGENDG